MADSDPLASPNAEMHALADSLGPANAQLRAAARDLLDGDRRSSDARKAEASRQFRRQIGIVVDRLFASAWDRAVELERAARSAGGA